MSDTEKIDNHYGYIPSQGAAIAFIAVFGLSTVLHVLQATLKRQWFLFPTVVLCGILEVVGWAGRLWSHSEPFLWNPFQMQIVATIIGPTPLLAANFVIFGRVIRELGTVYSRLTPKLYTIIFCICDVVSLAIQGVGGGIAANATTLKDANVGGNIMLGGIAFQLFVIVSYSTLAIEYMVRYAYNKPLSSIRDTHKDYSPRGELGAKTKVMLAALGFNTLTLFIRAVYRTIELADGWTGRIIQTEVYFNVLDGAMVVLAIYTFNIVHPGWFLPARSQVPVKGEDSHGSSVA